MYLHYGLQYNLNLYFFKKNIIPCEQWAFVCVFVFSSEIISRENILSIYHSLSMYQISLNYGKPQTVGRQTFLCTCNILFNSTTFSRKLHLRALIRPENPKMALMPAILYTKKSCKLEPPTLARSHTFLAPQFSVVTAVVNGYCWT